MFVTVTGEVSFEREMMPSELVVPGEYLNESTFSPKRMVEKVHLKLNHIPMRGSNNVSLLKDKLNDLVQQNIFWTCVVNLDTREAVVSAQDYEERIKLDEQAMFRLGEAMMRNGHLYLDFYITNDSDIQERIFSFVIAQPALGILGGADQGILQRFGSWQNRN